MAAQRLHLWRYHLPAGVWRIERTIEVESDADTWRERFERDEPTAIFRLSRRKPSKATDVELARAGYGRLPNTGEVIARKRTSDGKDVLLWDDGSLTWSLGYAIKGAWMKPSPPNRDRALRAGWLVLGDVELYDHTEVPALVKAARYVADRGGTPGDMRQRVHGDTRSKEAHRRPQWTVVSTDRDGRPTERVWKLPRLGPWSDYAVWDFVSRGGSRGRYSLHRRLPGTKDTYEPTGFQFKTLEQLFDHLDDVSVVQANPRDIERSKRLANP